MRTAPCPSPRWVPTVDVGAGVRCRTRDVWSCLPCVDHPLDVGSAPGDDSRGAAVAPRPAPQSDAGTPGFSRPGAVRDQCSSVQCGHHTCGWPSRLAFMDCDQPLVHPHGGRTRPQPAQLGWSGLGSTPQTSQRVGGALTNVSVILNNLLIT